MFDEEIYVITGDGEVELVDNKPYIITGDGDKSLLIEPVDEENENYLAVEDESTLTAVYEIFKERYKDVLTFAD